MLIELEAHSEARRGVLVNQIILFFLRQQRAPGQLWTSKLSTWTGGGRFSGSRLASMPSKGVRKDVGLVRKASGAVVLPCL